MQTNRSVYTHTHTHSHTLTQIHILTEKLTHGTLKKSEDEDTIKRKCGSNREFLGVPWGAEALSMWHPVLRPPSAHCALPCLKEPISPPGTPQQAGVQCHVPGGRLRFGPNNAKYKDYWRGLHRSSGERV